MGSDLNQTTSNYGHTGRNRTARRSRHSRSLEKTQVSRNHTPKIENSVRNLHKTYASRKCACVSGMFQAIDTSSNAIANCQPGVVQAIRKGIDFSASDLGMLGM
jgi:hypothetical protein